MSEDRQPASGIEWLLGSDTGGHWIVVERAGRFGGIFANEQAAMKFARFESAGAPCRISRSAGQPEFRAIRRGRPD